MEGVPHDGNLPVPESPQASPPPSVAPSCITIYPGGVGVSMMDHKVSPTPRSTQPLASPSQQQHSSEHPTTAIHPQHIDLQALHSSFHSAGHPHKILPQPRPQQVRAPSLLSSPNLSESNKELVLGLGLEEVYKCMAENHKFHIDVVWEVAAGQQCFEHADQVLCSMHKAAEHEYAQIMKQEFGVALQSGGHQTEESGEEEEEEEEEDATNLGNSEHVGLAPDL